MSLKKTLVMSGAALATLATTSLAFAQETMAAADKGPTNPRRTSDSMSARPRIIGV